MRMDTDEIRRMRLRQWFEKRSIPPKEKSFISQLLTGKSSFGEKAARRLEVDYGMGDRYLDKTPEQEKNELDAFLRGVGFGYVKASDIAELILLFSQATQKGRDIALDTLRASVEERQRGANGIAPDYKP